MSDAEIPKALTEAAAKSMPPEAWNILVSTATDSFRAIIRPITATTAGCGVWLEQWFAGLTDIQKLHTTDAFQKAKARIESDNRSVAPNGDLATFSELCDRTSVVTNPLLREMWINLLARELSSEEVHPEFCNILRRLSPSDAKALSEIAEQSETQKFVARHRAIQASRRELGISATKIVRSSATPFSLRRMQPFSLSDTVLETLGLIERENGAKYLTDFGSEFLRSVGHVGKKSP